MNAFSINLNLFTTNPSQIIHTGWEYTLEIGLQAQKAANVAAGCIHSMWTRATESMTSYAAFAPFFAASLIDSVGSGISQILHINKTYQIAIQFSLIVSQNLYNGYIQPSRTKEIEQLETEISKQVNYAFQSQPSDTEKKQLLELKHTLEKKKLGIKSAKMMALVQLPCLLLALLGQHPKNNSYHQTGQLISKLLLVIWQCRWVHEEIATALQVMPSVVTETIHIATLMEWLSTHPSEKDHSNKYLRLLSICVSVFWITYSIFFLFTSFLSRINQRFQQRL